MKDDPYESPKTQVVNRNCLAQIGFAMAFVGGLGTLSVGFFDDVATKIGMCVAFLSLPGFLASLVAWRKRPGLLAVVGCLLGGFGTFFLPTFYLSLCKFGSG